MKFLIFLFSKFNPTPLFLDYKDTKRYYTSANQSHTIKKKEKKTLTGKVGNNLVAM